MQTIKGPGIFLAQFMGDAAPFNNLKTICEWAKNLGFVGVQIPTWDSRCIDLQKAA
jgi:sugar phosphate isomerase/epimerase